MGQVFEFLRKHPVGAALSNFQPEYDLHQRGVRSILSLQDFFVVFLYNWLCLHIYRGPTTPNFVLDSLHAVYLVRVNEEDSEKFVWARSSQVSDFGHNGCIKVSLDTMIMHLPRVGGIPTSEFCLDNSQNLHHHHSYFVSETSVVSFTVD